MQHIQDGYRGLHFLVQLNLDRLLWPCAILAGLGIGQFLGSL